MTVAVSNEIRNQNSYWVNQRNKWRKKYSVLEEEIKNAKRAVRLYHSCGENYLANTYSVRLKALQTVANDMMIERYMITQNLVATAYRYI